MKTKKVILTNITEQQVHLLEQESKRKGMTISGLVKHWCETLIEKIKTEGVK